MKCLARDYWWICFCRCVAAGWVWLGFAQVLSAEVFLAPLFQDHAVLQAGQPVPVWGRADPGERVAVSFGGQTVEATTDQAGRWRATLAPLAINPSAAELVVTGKNTVRLADVLVGEVWFCSGQSNMVFSVNAPPGASYHLNNQEAETVAARYPLIRNFHVIPTVGGERPAETVQGAWLVCSPENMRDFTAAGYFFARELQQKLGVPVGIIEASWGGTPVEPWMSAEALAADPAFAVVGERWRRTMAEYPAKKARFDADFAVWRKGEAAAKSTGGEALATYIKTHSRPYAPRGPGNPWTPSGLYNGMVAPLVPYALRGVLWYQGESNTERAGEYRALFSAMIGQWRRDWAQKTLPFYFVQLANFRPTDPTGVRWAFLREAQSQTLALPDTGMAVTIDIGDSHNIHPGNKQEVGRRLALIALAKNYGSTGEYSGPMFQSVAAEGAALRVKFIHAEGLRSRLDPLTAFEIAGADRVFHPAHAIIEGDSVVVMAPGVASPVAVRYAWSNDPPSSLANGEGLPASPFRSDSW